MNDVLTTIFSVEFIYTTIRIMTPILFAALACMVFLKGGIDPIGTEGIMLMCSLAASIGSYFFKNSFLGVISAITCGVLLSFLFGYVTLSLKSEPILAGIALNTLASGLTIFIVFYITGEKGSTQSLIGPTVPNIHISIIEKVPVLGKILSNHNLLTYLGLLCTVLLSIFFNKMPTGLRIKSVGENPDAAKSVGINILKYKYITLFIAGTMAGFGGAFMSLGYVSFFSKEMIAGRGFIGMAAEAMGRGTSFGVFVSSFVFGMADALAIRLQMLNFPAHIIQTFPYIITIVAISLYSYSKTKNRSDRN